MSPRIAFVDIERRLLGKSRPVESGCREWTGATQKGYGALNVGGKIVRAHRLACELAQGPAPEGKPWALHKCHNSLCVEGAHLYWGDAKDNARDTLEAGHATGGRAGATHCVNGHEFTSANTYWEPRGWGRACRACRRIRVREHRARKRAMA